MIFNSGGPWSLYQCKDKRLLWLDDESLEDDWERMLFLEPDAANGGLYQVIDSDDINDVWDPLAYPLDQLLMMHLLAQGKGIMVHSCGVNYKGQGLLFVGSSGKGKTTIAQLLHQHGFEVFNDDRIIIRRQEDGLRMFGTPWHGTGYFAHPGVAPLKKIYFLEHGKSNKITQLSDLSATTKIISALFAPFWDKKGMQFSVDISAELVNRVCCNDLSFVPDENIINQIKETL